MGLIALLALFWFCTGHQREAHEIQTRTMLETTAVPYSGERTMTTIPHSPDAKSPGGMGSPSMSSPTISDFVNVQSPAARGPPFNPAPDGAGPSMSTLQVPPDPVRREPTPPGLATVPGLVNTLNELLSRLPRGAAHGEDPPMYGE